MRGVISFTLIKLIIHGKKIMIKIANITISQFICIKLSQLPPNKSPKADRANRPCGLVLVRILKSKRRYIGG